MDEKLQEVFNAIRAGKTLSKDQTEYIVAALGKSQAGKKPDGLSLEEFEGGLTQALDYVRNSPEGQRNLKEILAQKRTDRFTKRYTPFFNAVLAGADIATSLGQIKAANRAAGQLRRPELPPIPGIDPALNNSIADAQRGTMDVARAAGPARQELQDQYYKDLAQAKQIGGGQVGTYGALGQVASMRRARGAAALLPGIDAIRAREQGRLDNLVNQRGQFAQQQFYDRFQNANARLGQYNLDSQAIGALGAAGRSNRRAGVASLLQAVPGVAARIGQGYGDRYTQYEQSLNSSLTNNGSKVPNPYSQLETPDDYTNQYSQYNPYNTPY
jgi:hypothetical protein